MQKKKPPAATGGLTNDAACVVYLDYTTTIHRDSEPCQEHAQLFAGRFLLLA